jgi:2,3-bisphosphoglycerate-independent phosphoglycerate mutase
MKAAIIVCDGMADRPIKELGGKTPLEAANTPNMDELAKRGICGIADPIYPGTRAGSDTSHLAILGYDPFKTYTGRGPLEAVGMGIKLEAGDVAFRCNFATIDGNVITDRRAGRIKETEELAEIIRNITVVGAEVLFKSIEYRGALVFRGEGLSGQVSESDPHVPGEPMHNVEPLDDTPEARRTADITNDFIKKAKGALKENSPANMLILRGAGIMPDLEPFKEKRGVSGACIATTAIIRGIASLVGLEVVDAENDYKDRIKQALVTLKGYDFLLMNIKEADEAAHDRDYKKKIDVIEQIDAALGPFLDFAGDNYVAIMSDHTTPVSFGDHTGDPVPVVIAGPEVRTDCVAKFDERSAAEGGLCRLNSSEVLPIMLNLMNMTEKFGA